MKRHTALSLRYLVVIAALIGVDPLAWLTSPAYATQSTETKQDLLPYQEFFKYDSFTLDNGLRVIVHEDRSAPAISVTSYFHVGSKNEPFGKTGFAHLFEHLLFNGTKNAPGEFFEYLNEIGATGANGTTNYDHTNYFQTVPTGALERMLWLESDRFVTFMDGLTEEGLRRQIDVVKNEKGQRDNSPFGKVVYDQMTYLYPHNHPYSRSVIGSVEDLENATLEDVRKWFKDYYGARNMVLVLAGDIDSETAEPLVKKYFERMQPGASISRIKAYPVKRTMNTFQVAEDIASDSSLERSYILPPATSRESSLPSIALSVFAGGQESRLSKYLEEEKRLAKFVAIFSIGGELNSGFTISATPAEGVSLDTLSAEIDKLFAEYLIKGPSKEDLASHHGQIRSMYINASESLQAKARLLGEGLLYHNDPHQELKAVAWINSVKPKELIASANKWLKSGYHQTYKIALEDIDLPKDDFDYSVMPPVKATLQKDVPKPERFKLSNGLEVVYAYKENSPRVLLDYVSPVGRAHYDIAQSRHQWLVNLFLKEGGAGGVSRTKFSKQKATIGAEFSATVSREFTNIGLSTDLEVFDQAFMFWRDILLRPNFDKKDFEFFKNRKLQDIDSDKKSPDSVVADIVGEKVYGTDRYDTAEDQLEFWKNADIEIAKDFVETNIRPENARLYVVGGIKKARLNKMLEQELRNWKGRVEPRNIIRREFEPKPARPQFILINDEGATQTSIQAMRTLPLVDKDHYKEQMVNSIWGGGFTSRLNLNLREDKGWTYGINSSLETSAERDSVWRIDTSVTDKHTVASIREIIREIEDINSGREVDAAELKKAIDPAVKSFSNYITQTSILPTVYFQNDLLGKPHEYIGEYPERLKTISLTDIKKIVPKMIRSNDLYWTLVGDLDEFEAELRDQNLGDIEVYDISGKRLR